MARETLAVVRSERDAFREECDRLRIIIRGYEGQGQSPAPAANGKACKRCDGTGWWREADARGCKRCGGDDGVQGSGIDPGKAEGRRQFKERGEVAKPRAPRALSPMADAARRYCEANGVTSCTVEQARSMLEVGA